jgi:hypothetical protein
MFHRTSFRCLEQEPQEAHMPGRQSRRSVLAAMAALPLAGALGACSGANGASALSASLIGRRVIDLLKPYDLTVQWRRLADPAVGEVARWAAGQGFAHAVRHERPACLA